MLRADFSHFFLPLAGRHPVPRRPVPHLAAAPGLLRAVREESPPRDLQGEKDLRGLRGGGRHLGTILTGIVHGLISRSYFSSPNKT